MFDVSASYCKTEGENIEKMNDIQVRIRKGGLGRPGGRSTLVNRKALERNIFKRL